MTALDREIHVVNNLGMAMPESITSLPRIRLTDLGPDEPVPEDLRADVVYAHTHGGANLPELLTRGVRWVQVIGVGVDRFPLDALTDDQVLACARGATAVPIAEFVMAAMLASAKAMPEVWLDGPPENGWFTRSRLTGLHEKTVVIVGTGGIGAQVARHCLGFGMRVIGVRRQPLPSPVVGMEISTSLAEVIAEADHLVLAAPATRETVRLVDRELLALARPGLHLVNIARGTLVDEDALRAALDDGTLVRATLDAVEPEPLPAGHWMYDHPGVRLSPHVSWAGPGALTSMTDAFVTNYHHFVAGRELEGVVDRELGY
ncbi:MAG: NAD(P)-dependent oxidoreductase [Acidimicrobiales bacterium]